MTLLKGQTMIEMLVVLFIISMGLYGAVTLVFTNVLLQQQDKDMIVAMNLEREAMEIAQNIRDTNWLNNQSFSKGMLDIGGGCRAVPWYNATAAPSFKVTAAALGTGDTRINQSTNMAAPLVWTHNTGSGTDYYRVVALSPICANTADHTDKQYPSGCGCGGAPYTDVVGVRVKADIQWIRQNRTKSVTLYSDLYDWR